MTRRSTAVRLLGSFPRLEPSADQGETPSACLMAQCCMAKASDRRPDTAGGQ